MQNQLYFECTSTIMVQNNVLSVIDIILCMFILDTLYFVFSMMILHGLFEILFSTFDNTLCINTTAVPIERYIRQ